MKPGPQTRYTPRKGHSHCRCGRLKAQGTRCCFRCSGDADTINRLVMQGREATPLKSLRVARTKAAIERCNRELAEIAALPVNVPAKAIDITMAQLDWEHERRLIEQEMHI